MLDTLPPELLLRLLSVFVPLHQLALLDCVSHAFHGPLVESVLRERLRLRGAASPAAIPHGKASYYLFGCELVWADRVLHLHPLRDDGPSKVCLPLNGIIRRHHPTSVHAWTQIILGRSSRAEPNQSGLDDPRISRRHLRVAESRHTRGETASVTALGANGLGIVRRGGKAPMCEILQKSMEAELFDGDHLYTIIEGWRGDFSSDPFEPKYTYRCSYGWARCAPCCSLWEWQRQEEATAIACKPPRVSQYRCHASRNKNDG